MSFDPQNMVSRLTSDHFDSNFRIPWSICNQKLPDELGWYEFDVFIVRSITNLSSLLYNCPLPKPPIAIPSPTHMSHICRRVLGYVTVFTTCRSFSVCFQLALYFYHCPSVFYLFLSFNLCLQNSPLKKILNTDVQLFILQNMYDIVSPILVLITSYWQRPRR